MPLEEQRERILGGATTVFATEGFDGATSEQIAEAAGIGRPTIYNLFGSKHDVFLAAVERALRRILDHLVAAIEESTEAGRRQHTGSGVAAFFELVDHEPDTIRLLRLADTSGDAPTRQAAAASRRRLEDTIGRYLQAALGDARSVSDADAGVTAAMVIAAVEAAAFRHLDQPDRSTDEVVHLVTTFLRHGLVPRP